MSTLRITALYEVNFTVIYNEFRSKNLKNKKIV
jgi:hypothetical protein